MPDKLFIGADVAQDWIDLAVAGQPGQACRIANTAEAIAGWIATLDAAGVGLVAFEPTGGLERSLRHGLIAAGVACARVHPNEVAAFRTRRGVKAKTDALDARLLADFAALELSGRGLAPLVETDETLRDLLARRRQLIETRHAERCRAARAVAAIVRDSIAALLAVLGQQIVAVDQAIAAHIAVAPELARAESNLRTLKGVGPVTAATMLGELPELGRFSGKEIAAPRLRAGRLWSVSPRATATAARRSAKPAPATAGPASARRCSTPPASPSASTRSCGTSIAA